MKTEDPSTAHLLHGFVGAGKTTFARKLERERRAVRFTHDEWMHRLYGPNPPIGQFQEYSRRVDAIIWDLVLNLLNLGVEVILDFGFWTRDSRARAIERVRNCGARPLLYAVTCPDRLMKARVMNRTRDLPGDSLFIDEDAFELFRSRFEPMGADEDCIRIDGREEQEHACHD